MNSVLRFFLMASMLAVPLAYGDEFAEMKEKAEAGDGMARLEIARRYEQGLGVGKSVKEAIVWFTKAAEQGNVDAQMFLGGIYLRGAQVPKNSNEAAKWYLMAAEQGNKVAQCQASRLHMMGAGVPKDDVEAYKWANLAAAQGDMAAKKILMILERRMSKEEVKQGQELSRLHKELGSPEQIELPAPPLEELDPAAIEPDAGVLESKPEPAVEEASQN